MKELIEACEAVMTWKAGREAKHATQYPPGRPVPAMIWQNDSLTMFAKVEQALAGVKRPAPGLTPEQIKLGIRHPRYVK